MRVSLILMLLLVLSACASPSKRLSPALKGFSQRGMASWYGERFHGRKTASGERYDMNRLTAAHPSLPFGTMVRVKNLATGQSVRVRINDRGPFAKSRIIDLSRAAATKLGMIRQGQAEVEVRAEAGP